MTQPCVITLRFYLPCTLLSLSRDESRNVVGNSLLELGIQLWRHLSTANQCQSHSNGQIRSGPSTYLALLDLGEELSLGLEVLEEVLLPLAAVNAGD